MAAATCLAIIEASGSYRRHRFGMLCRRRATGYIAPGHPRCGYHLTERKRVRVRAMLEAERELRALRLLEDADAGAEDEHEPERHEDADGTTWTEVVDRDATPLESPHLPPLTRQRAQVIGASSGTGSPYSR